MKKEERTCENCKALKNQSCMGRSKKYAKECPMYKQVCKICGGTGLVSIGDRVRGLKTCMCR